MQVLFGGLLDPGLALRTPVASSSTARVGACGGLVVSLAGRLVAITSVLLPTVSAAPGASSWPGFNATRCPASRVHTGFTPGISSTRRPVASACTLR